MPDYKKMYAVLCKAVDNAIDPLEQIPSAKQIAKSLQDALLEAEEIYINTTPYTETSATAQIIGLNTDN